MLTTLSRGYGAWLQPVCLNTSSGHYEQLPHISQDVHHHSHRVTYRPRARSAPVKMPATGGGQINIPKTFLTRSGALLLFAVQDDPPQIPPQQMQQRKLRRRNLFGDNLEFKTVEGLRRAVLQYGNRDSDVNFKPGDKMENDHVLNLKKMRLRSHPPSQVGEPVEFYLENLRKMTNMTEQKAGLAYQTKSAELQEILQDFHKTLTDVREEGRQKTWPLTSVESLSNVRQTCYGTTGDTSSRSPSVNRTRSARSVSASKTSTSTRVITPKCTNVSNQPAPLSKRTQRGQQIEEMDDLRVKEDGWSPPCETEMNESIFRVNLTEKPGSNSIKPRQKKVMTTKETRQTNVLELKQKASRHSMGTKLGSVSDDINDIQETISDSFKDIQDTVGDSIKDKQETFSDSIKDKQETLNDKLLAKHKAASVILEMNKPVDTTVTHIKVDIIQREVTSVILARTGSRVKDHNQEQSRLTQNNSIDDLNVFPSNAGQVVLAEECNKSKESEVSMEMVHLDKSEIGLQPEELWYHKDDFPELCSPQNQARVDYQNILDKNETLSNGVVESNLVYLSDHQDEEVGLAFLTMEKVVHTYLPEEKVVHTSLPEDTVVQTRLPEDKCIQTFLQENNTQVREILQTSQKQITEEEKVLHTDLQKEVLQTSCNDKIEVEQVPQMSLQLRSNQELQDDIKTDDWVIPSHDSSEGGYFKKEKDLVEQEVEELQKLHLAFSEGYSSESIEDSESLTVISGDSGIPNVNKNDFELSTENLSQIGNTQTSKRQDGKVKISHSQNVSIEFSQNLKNTQANQEKILEMSVPLPESSGQNWNDNVETLEGLLNICKEGKADVLSENAADVEITAPIDSETLIDDTNYSDIEVVNNDTDDMGYTAVLDIQEKNNHNTHGDEKKKDVFCAKDDVPSTLILKTISTNSSNITETSNHLLHVRKETEKSFDTKLQGTNDDMMEDPQMQQTEDRNGQVHQSEDRPVQSNQTEDKQRLLNQTGDNQEQIHGTKERQVQTQQTEEAQGQEAANSIMSGVDTTTLSGVDTTKMFVVDTTTLSRVNNTTMSGVDITTMSGVDTTKTSGVNTTTLSGVDTTSRQQEPKLLPTKIILSSSAKKRMLLDSKYEDMSDRNITSKQSVAMSGKNTSSKKSSVVKQRALTNPYSNSSQPLGKLMTMEVPHTENLQNESTKSLDVTQEEAPLIRVQSYVTQQHPGIRSHPNISAAQKQAFVPRHLREITTRTTDLQTYNEFEAEIRKIERVLVDDLLGKDAQLLDETEGLSAEDFVLARGRLMVRIKQAEEWLQNGFNTEDLGKAKSQHSRKRKISKKEKAQHDELAKENEAVREYHRQETQIRFDTIRDLTDKITLCEELRMTQEAETNAKLEELAEEIETLKREVEEITKTEADARTQVAALRRAKREERANNRKIELENKRKSAFERRAKQKTMKEADLQKELDKLSKVAEEEVVSRHRDEEEAKLEQEEIAALERLEVDMLAAEKAADDEEDRLVFLEKQAEEEAFLHLVSEKEAAEKRRREIEEQVRIVREEQERSRQTLLDEVKRLSDEILILQDEEEQLRLQKMDRVRELQRAEQEAKSSLLAALQQKRISALRRREHNLRVRDNRDAICHSQEFTDPWTFSYFVKWTYALNQRLLEQNKKKQKRTVSAKMSASSKALNPGVNASVK